MKLPQVAIFADASVCGSTGAAGWGGWAVSNARSCMATGGPLLTRFRSSTDAELAAIAQAVDWAWKEGFIRYKHRVMVMCDNIHALGMIRHAFSAQDAPLFYGLAVPPLPVEHVSKGQRRSEGGAGQYLYVRRDAIMTIRRVVKAEQATLIVRHVRGHQGPAAAMTDDRAAVNQICDRLARAGMKQARKEMAHGNPC